VRLGKLPVVRRTLFYRRCSFNSWLSASDSQAGHTYIILDPLILHKGLVLTWLLIVHVSKMGRFWWMFDIFHLFYKRNVLFFQCKMCDVSVCVCVCNKRHECDYLCAGCHRDVFQALTCSSLFNRVGVIAEPTPWIGRAWFCGSLWTALENSSFVGECENYDSGNKAWSNISAHFSTSVRGYIQKYLDWPPAGVRIANSTALCH
jgi:hypothetical protein